MAKKNNSGSTACLARERLDEDIEGEIARAKRYGKPMSLLMIGIEWANRNDVLQGSQKRDELLDRIGAIALRNVRVVDRVYLYGGGILVVLLPESDKVEALSTAERLQKILERAQHQRRENNLLPERLAVSMGVVSYPWDANARNELLASAESALRAAKQSRKNKICFFDFDNHNLDTAAQPIGRIRGI